MGVYVYTMGVDGRFFVKESCTNIEGVMFVCMRVMFVCMRVMFVCMRRFVGLWALRCVHMHMCTSFEKI